MAWPAPAATSPRASRSRTPARWWTPRSPSSSCPAESSPWPAPETLVIPYRIDDEALADRHETLLTRSRGLTLVELDRPLLRVAACLRATTGVRTPDALQLAAALATRCTAYLTNDPALPRLPGLPVLQLRDYA